MFIENIQVTIKLTSIYRKLTFKYLCLVTILILKKNKNIEDKNIENKNLFD
jgi:hypothetical protein